MLDHENVNCIVGVDVQLVLMYNLRVESSENDLYPVPVEVPYTVRPISHKSMQTGAERPLLLLCSRVQFLSNTLVPILYQPL